MWYDYQSPKTSSINEVCKRLQDAEIFPGTSPRTHKILARVKAASYQHVPRDSRFDF